MSYTLLQSQIANLQLQIKNKKQEFNEGIRENKEFSQMKEIYLEIKELEKMLQLCLNAPDV